MSQEQLWNAGPIVTKSRRGRPITTCVCGNCYQCNNRSYMRLYMRDRAAGVKRNHPLDHDWTAEEEALLGTDTDKAIGERLGLAPQTVHKRRRKLGIARAKPHVAVSQRSGPADTSSYAYLQMTRSRR